MKNIISSVLVAGSMVLASGVQAASIDDFNGAGTLIVEADGSQTAAYSNAIGGSRTDSITKSGPLGASAGVLVPPGVFAHSADVLTSAETTITWDANGTGLGGVDINEGRVFSVFSFDVLSIDQGNVDLTFVVKDTLGNMASAVLAGIGTGLQSVAFNEFAGIDFTTIDSIALMISGGEASDLVIDNLKTVPTPASMILVLIGLAAFSMNRKQPKPEFASQV